MSAAQDTIRFFWQASWKHKWHTIAVLVTSPMAVLFHAFLSSLVVAAIIEKLATGNYIQEDFFGSFGTLIGLFVLIYFIGNVVLYRLFTYVTWQLESRVERDLAKQSFTHLIDMDIAFHADRFGGSLVSQTSKFIIAYDRVLTATTRVTMPLAVSFIFSAIILFPRVPQYIPILLLLALAYIVVALISSKRIRHYNEVESKTYSKQTGILSDAITNILTVKSFARSDYETKRYETAIDDTMNASQSLMHATIGRDTAFSLVGSAFSVAAVTMAVVGVMYLKADLGTAFLMLTYSLLIARHLWDFSSKALREYNRAFGDAHEMIEILNAEPAVRDAPKPLKRQNGKGSVSFKDVSFTHPQAGDALFHNFNLDIKAGEKIGLIGRSGAGKTTLTKLLLRFANIDAGEILINDQDISKLSQQDVRNQMAYVPQEPLLFHRSIAENIAYGKPNATKKEVEKAAKKAYAAAFIEKLPNGYNTLVGERGVKLSGGQRQRIAIARAILKDAPILVLDEATSALDSESEKAIQSALWELMKGRTALVIAHRLSTIAKLDRIVVMDNGRVVEQGTHEDLLKKNGIYSALWSHQSGGFIED